MGPTNLSREQDHAIELCTDLKERIVGVTGGAGTGKSTVLRHIYEQLVSHTSVVLVAPTGRAAKRIEELSGIKAKTIHRLLEFPQPVEGEPQVEGPQRNRTRPLEERVVIVDEASMVGPVLFRQLMDALPLNGCVRFIGDNNQLRPVEPGAPPFITILERFPSVELSFNFRSEDAIVSNALRILNGSIPVPNERFQIVYVGNPIRELIRLATGAFSDLAHQIILPTRRANHGTMRVNTSLQLKLNGAGPFLRLNRMDEKEAPLVMRKDDKFLWVKNDYGLELFNGEIGKVDWIDEDGGALGLVTSDREVTVPPRAKMYSQSLGMTISYDPRKHVEHGYAITTHKAQGSEFDTVIYAITTAHSWMLSRRNFYTAVTRARNNVVVIADRTAMSRAVRRGRDE